jgi:hypothetical protein
LITSIRLPTPASNMFMAPAAVKPSPMLKYSISRTQSHSRPPPTWVPHRQVRSVPRHSRRGGDGGTLVTQKKPLETSMEKQQKAFLGAACTPL